MASHFVRGDTSPVAAPNGHADPVLEQRHAFAAALEELRAESERLDRLRTASSEASERAFAADEALRVAEEYADTATTREPVVRANLFADTGQISGEASAPLKAAMAQLTAARSDAESVMAVKATLDSEIAAVQQVLPRLRRRVDDCIAALLIASPQWEQLHEAHHQAWVQLRSIRLCLAAVSRHADHPKDFSRWQPTESMDPNTSGRIGETDPTLTLQWNEFFERLLSDPHTPMPDVSV